MSERQPPSFDELDARLREARGRVSARNPSSERDALPRSALGLAFRIGAELVAAMIVGVGGGLLLDRWLGTEPWGLVGMFFLGAGAGILNVYRAVSGIGMGPGYHRDKADATDGPEDRNA